VSCIIFVYTNFLFYHLKKVHIIHLWTKLQRYRLHAVFCWQRTRFLRFLIFMSIISKWIHTGLLEIKKSLLRWLWMNLCNQSECRRHAAVKYHVAVCCMFLWCLHPTVVGPMHYAVWLSLSICWSVACLLSFYVSLHFSYLIWCLVGNCYFTQRSTVLM